MGQTWTATATGSSSQWVRVDSAGYRADVVEAAERHDAAFTITAKGYTNVRAAIEALALCPNTSWVPAMATAMMFSWWSQPRV